MVWPWKVFYSIVDLAVRITCTFSTELPYRPLGAMFVVEELDKGVGWVAVSALGIRGGWARGGNDWLGIRKSRLLPK